MSAMFIDSRTLEEHAGYVRDGVRLEKFEAAISASVKEGDVVLDLGAGTGILGMLACRAGARRVYVVDRGPMLEVAKAAYAANGFGERAVFVAGHSREVTLPEKVDVIVADQLAYFGSGAGLFESLEDGVRRFLREGGTLIPSGLRLALAPVESAELAARLSLWDSRPSGVEMGAVREMLAAAAPWPVELEAGQLLGAPGFDEPLDLYTCGSGSFSVSAGWEIERGGTLHGLGGWFEATLSDGVRMTNSPLAEDGINRPCAYFPLDPPLEVAVGDRLEANVQAEPHSGIARWSVRRAGGETLREQSSLPALMLTKADLARRHPEYRPTLNPKGKLAHALLALCTGEHKVEEIVAKLVRRGEDAVASEAELMSRVIEMLDGWAE